MYKKNVIQKPLFLFLGISLLVSISIPATQSNPSQVEQRVDKILQQMTLEEKLDYIGGYEDFYIRAIDRLKLPAIKMSDGPIGVRNYGPTTAYPGGIALAATWNPELAARFGTSIGHDGRARGVHIWLAPAVNIFRSPLCGRNFEYLGEDPYLAGKMVVPIVQNVQKEGVLATVKHYACNNNEYGRNYTTSDIDERTLREIYLPTFKAAVTEGKAACVMNAYNMVNGMWCTENDFLNNQVLKKEWKFDGILMSDWGATHNALRAALGGLDLEMPSARYMNPSTMLSLLKEGKISKEMVDDKVRRILRVITRAGFLDRPQQISSIPIDDPASRQTALAMAKEGIVLLKNDKNLLPLVDKKIKSIAIFGPNATPGIPEGGGSAFTTPNRTVSILQGIQDRAQNNIKVSYNPFTPEKELDKVFNSSKYQYVAEDGSIKEGLQAQYFDVQSYDSTFANPVYKTVVPTVNYDWNKNRPSAFTTDRFAVRLTGQIKPDQSGEYTFVLRSDTFVKIYLNDTVILNDWYWHGIRVHMAKVSLESGKTYDLKVELSRNRRRASVTQFGWGDVTEPVFAADAEMARKADVAVVCIGFTSSEEGEGFDRTFDLPWGQKALVEAVVAANPHTVVILNSGGGVAMQDWINKIPALIQAWYPGQEGGTALAAILFGDINPSGKLPATFEKKWEDNPSYPYYMTKDGKSVPYTEGVFVGYRGYDSKEIEPQFCFGYGLSYTQFGYSNLKITPATKSGQSKFKVKFNIKNTGDRAGAEIAQLYVHEYNPLIPRPVKELKGFKKVYLKPGESKTIELTLEKDAFSYFDPTSKQWVADPGEFEIRIGSSSRDIRLRGDLLLKS